MPIRLSLEGVRLIEIELKTNKPWTIEQLLSLCATEHHVRSVRNFAVESRWTCIGTDGEKIWAKIVQKNRADVNTVVQLQPLAFNCDCPQTIYPCHHALGLAILSLEEDIQHGELPSWAVVSKKKAYKNNEEFEQTKRLEQIRTGLEKTELWLKDIVSIGLEHIRSKQADYYRAHAAELTNIGAQPLAKEIESWAFIDKRDWAKELLARISRIYLLIKAFKNYENLNPKLQADLRMAVSWRLNKGLSESKDSWLVLGWYKDISSRYNSQKIYLYGTKSKQYALLHKRLYKREELETALLTGSSFEASIDYYPSANPLLAELREDIVSLENTPLLPDGFTSIKEAVSNYSEKKSKNPWLQIWPMSFEKIDLVEIKNAWYLIDNLGFVLPLAPRAGYLWHLKAIAKEADLWIFGEWDGYYFNALSVLSRGRLLDLRNLQGGRRL